MTATTKYLESLDSVRFAEGADARTPVGLAECQSEIEIAISVLLGHPIVVSESMSFDSQGLLRAAATLLPGLPEPEQMARAVPPQGLGFNLHASLVAPFRLALLDASMPYAEMVARRFEATYETAKPFVLSAWPQMTADAALRRALAGCIRAGRWRGAESLVVSTFAGTPFCDPYLEKIQALRQLVFYFESLGAEAVTTAVKPATPLTRYVQAILAPELALSYRGTAFEDTAREVQATAAALAQAGIELDNRSQVRLRGTAVADPQRLARFVEFLDTAYNQVVSESVGATVAVFSTPCQARLARETEMAQLLFEDLRSRVQQAPINEATDIDLQLTQFDRKVFPFLFPLAAIRKNLLANDEWNFTLRRLADPALAGTERTKIEDRKWQVVKDALKNVAVQAHSNKLVVHFLAAGGGILGSYVVNQITNTMDDLFAATAGFGLGVVADKFVGFALGKTFEFAAAGYSGRLERFLH